MAGCAVALVGLILAAAPPPADAKRETARADEPPSAEMLLYLAEFVDADGEAIDPTELESPSKPNTPARTEAPVPSRSDRQKRAAREKPIDDPH